MSLTVEEARDTALAVVHTAWTASGAASEDVPLLFDNVKGDPPDLGTVAGRVDPYARASVRILVSDQSTQGRQRRYLSEGSLSVQIFTAPGDGWGLADQLSRVVVNALRGHAGTPDGLWFFEVGAFEVGQTGAWRQVNAEARFRFQETAP